MLYISIFNLLYFNINNSTKRIDLIKSYIPSVLTGSGTVGDNYNQGFSLFAFIYSMVAFFLAPFFYIGNKRLVGLNVCQLLANKKIKIYIDSK